MALTGMGFFLQMLGRRSNQNAMPKGLDHKAWMDFLGFPPNTRPWEEAPFFGVPADDNNTAWIIRGFLSDKEVDHILSSVLPVAGFEVAGRGEMLSWDHSAPLAGAGLAEDPSTVRHQDSRNWTDTSNKGEAADQVLFAIERRVTQLTGIPYHDRESPLQIGVTKPHSYQGVPVGTSLHHDINSRFHRVASVIMYLSDEEHDGLVGGHTLFPCLRPPDYAETAARRKAEDEQAAEEAAKQAEEEQRRADMELSVLEYVRRKAPLAAKALWRSLPTYRELVLGERNMSVCEQLLHDFDAFKLIKPHPNAVEADAETLLEVDDAKTAIEANQICEQPFKVGKDPSVLLMTPKRGDAILFLSAHPDTGEHFAQTWHQGCAVKRGTKYTLQKFKEVWPDGYGGEFNGTKYDLNPKLERLRAEAEYRRTYGTLRRTHVAPIQVPRDELAEGGAEIPPQCADVLHEQSNADSSAAGELPAAK
jgi:hypothetical protein